jgi:hypothetical protein
VLGFNALDMPETAEPMTNETAINYPCHDDRHCHIALCQFFHPLYVGGDAIEDPEGDPHRNDAATRPMARLMNSMISAVTIVPTSWLALNPDVICTTSDWTTLAIAKMTATITMPTAMFPS